MDKRTVKLRELRDKLNSSRALVRQLTYTCIDVLNKGQQLDSAYWAKEGIKSLEATREGD